MPTCLQDGQTILFIGDSITDCGRRDTQHAPLGCGYVKFFHDMLLIREPTKSVRVINTGIGGNTVEDLRSRWVDDAFSHKPDWLSIKIGINDTHRYVTNAQANALQSPEQFEAIYDQLLELTRRELPQTKLILIDPFYAGMDQDERIEGAFRSRLWPIFQKYLAAVDRLGEKYQTLRVHTHAAFHAHFEHQHPSTYFPNEPVHPNQAGHLLIAETVYNALCKAANA